jgi:hypothetical protein
MKNRPAKAVAVVAMLLALGVAGVARAEIEQVGNLRVTVSGNLSPTKLPRDSKKPISVSVDWKISTTDGTSPPKLKTLKIEINRQGILDPTGLPACPYDKIQPATTSRALANCRSSLVGRGRFAAIVGLEGQESYLSSGQMVVFNSEKGGKPVLYGQIYTDQPFANSFVITFRVTKLKKGPYGTVLSATLPPSLRAWGNLTEIDMTLSRKFSFEGKRRSFLSAACPTPKGVPVSSFPLARTSFRFTGGNEISTTLRDECRPKG